MELLISLFLIPIGLGALIACAILALFAVVGIIALVTLFIIAIFDYIFAVMVIIGFISLITMGYYSPLLLFLVLLFIGIIWLYPEPKGENRKEGLPFTAIFNLLALPLLIAYFYYIVELGGLIAVFLGILCTLAFDAALAIKRPNLFERKFNFLWLY